MALLSKREKISQKYDVVIIGGGLGGMTAANILGRYGRKVLLLEAHNKLGGLATWFRRQSGKHVFDISLHGFPYGMVKTCKKYWNRDIANRIRQVEKIRFINPQYEIETDFTKEDFSRILIEYFQAPENQVHAFFNELAQMNYYDPPQLNNRELFEKYFPNRPDITRFLLEPIVYANGSNLEDPAISYGIVFSNFMNKGVFIFEGGTDLMIKLMKEELIKNNVDIRLHSKVDKINVENQESRGVQVGDEVIDCDTVISNGSLHKTILSLVGESHFEKEFIENLKKVRVNTSSCQVFMGLKKGESIPNIGELIFCSDDSEFSTDKILSNQVRSQTFSVYYPEMRPHLDNYYGVVSSSNARYEDWCNLSESEYKKQKEFVIERALVGLEKIVPGIRDKIDYIDASTPLTVEKFTHHLKGASFGTKFEGLPFSMNLHEKIKGLYHSGSVGIIMSGWLGAANYGVIQARQVEDYLMKLNGE